MPVDLSELRKVSSGLYEDGTPYRSEIVDDAIAEIEALRAAAVGVNVGAEWQPIETAPRDGTPFIAYWLRRYGDGTRYEAAQAFVVAHYQGDRMFPSWINTDDMPTHWTPPPRPPSEVGVNVGVNGAEPETPATTSTP